MHCLLVNDFNLTKCVQKLEPCLTSAGLSPSRVWETSPTEKVTNSAVELIVGRQLAVRKKVASVGSLTPHYSDYSCWQSVAG
eukprot:851068-Amphidinium_carterae.1